MQLISLVLPFTTFLILPTLLALPHPDTDTSSNPHPLPHLLFARKGLDVCNTVPCQQNPTSHEWICRRRDCAGCNPNPIPSKNNQRFCMDPPGQKPKPDGSGANSMATFGLPQYTDMGCFQLCKVKRWVKGLLW